MNYEIIEHRYMLNQDFKITYYSFYYPRTITYTYHTIRLGYHILEEYFNSKIKLHFSKNGFSENSYALLSLLCLLSPDRGDISARDRQQLDRLQVSFLGYLLRKDYF